MKQTSVKAGVYVRQPTGYKAFIPEPLPPSVELSLGLASKLEAATASLGRLDGISRLLPNPNLFVAVYVRKEAVLSSQIEGTQASLADVLQAEARVKSSRLPGDVAEVSNYVTALTHATERQAVLPISGRLLKELHAILLKTTRGSEWPVGEFRSQQNWIGPQGGMLQDAVFVPPPPHEIGRLMADLEKFIHQDSELPSLIRIAIAHAQFETIHPFVDGNGRIGRMLISILLQDRKLLERPTLYLSLYLKRRQAEYYALLQGIRDHGQWEAWIQFFLEVIRDAAQDASAKAIAIVELRERIRKLSTGQAGKNVPRFGELIDGLFERPYITAPSIIERFQVSPPTANRWIQALIEAEVVRQLFPGKRYRVFEFREFMTLLHEE
jgi:Fic family protein